MRRPFASIIVFAFIFTVSALPAAPNGSPGDTLALPIQAKFSIQYAQGYKVLTVDQPWPGAVKAYRYVLYPRGSAKPAAAKADRYIEVPVRKAVSFSTTYLPVLESIGALDSLVGVDSIDYVYNPTVRDRASQGKIAQTTKNWMPDIERLISLSPDVVFTYGVGNEWDTYPKMVEAGLPVVMVGEWNETDPLARAVWMVFIAAFYDKENLALEQFAQIETRYSQLKMIAKDAGSKPVVLTSGPFSGTWSVPSGDSYMTRLIEDAGATQPWAGSPGTGSLTLSVEAVYAKALGASIWLNPSGTAATLADVKALDPRFSSLPALAKGEVWNNNRRTTASGGNDYYESAVMRPHDVLADLVAIFHPELLPGHEFTYYRKLAK